MLHHFSLRLSLLVRRLPLASQLLLLRSRRVQLDLPGVPIGLLLRRSLNHQLTLQLLVLQKRLVHVALVARSRALLNSDIARVWREQCVRLLALLDVLVLRNTELSLPPQTTIFETKRSRLRARRP